MVIKRYFILFFILSSLASLAKAQEGTLITGTNLTQTEQGNATDTIPVIEIEDPDLDNIISLRAQFEKQNRSYSAPYLVLSEFAIFACRFVVKFGQINSL